MKVWETNKSFTRPADTTAYAANDLVANSTTAGSVVPLTFVLPAGASKLTRVKLHKTGATATNASFTLHLFEDSPTVTNGDNGAFSSTEADKVGTVALDATGSQSSDDTSVSVTTDIVLTPDVDRYVYGLLEAEAAYTPESAEVFTITLSGTTDF